MSPHASVQRRLSTSAASREFSRIKSVAFLQAMAMYKNNFKMELVETETRTPFHEHKKNGKRPSTSK
jgi:hypothetical protein